MLTFLFVFALSTFQRWYLGLTFTCHSRRRREVSPHMREFSPFWTKAHLQFHASSLWTKTGNCTPCIPKKRLGKRKLPALPQEGWFACYNRICGCKVVSCCGPHPPRDRKDRWNKKGNIEQVYKPDENGCSHADPTTWQPVSYRDLTCYNLRRQKCHHCKKYIIPQDIWEGRRIGEEGWG